MASVKFEFSRMKQELAAELELKALIQEEISKKSGPADGKRELPRVEGAASPPRRGHR